MLRLLRPTEPFHITQNFGVRSPRYKTYHHGIDLRIRNVPNKEIKSALGGKVTKVDSKTNFSWFTGGKANKNYGKGSPYGVSIQIESEVEEIKYFTLYAHLSSTDLKVGDEVRGGQAIGTGGTTGLSTGDHLHFEIRKEKDLPEHAFNPVPYFTDDVVSEWARKGVDFVVENGLMTSDRPQDTITREEVATVLERYHRFIEKDL